MCAWFGGVSVCMGWWAFMRGRGVGGVSMGWDCMHDVGIGGVWECMHSMGLGSVLMDGNVWMTLEWVVCAW
jgi:hypothetical protein